MENPETRPRWSVSGSGVLRLLLVTFGGLFAIILIAAAVWFVSAAWITPRERRVALNALDCISEVKHAGAIDDGAYQVKIRSAEDAVKRAQRVAFTSRDNSIATGVNVQLMWVEMARADAANTKLLKERGINPPCEASTGDRMEILMEKTLRATLGDKDSGK